MNKWQSSTTTRGIQIIYDGSNNSVTCKTQLDNELTIRILEVCLRNLKDKASLKKAVPIGKEK